MSWDRVIGTRHSPGPRQSLRVEMMISIRSRWSGEVVEVFVLLRGVVMSSPELSRGDRE